MKKFLVQVALFSIFTFLFFQIRFVYLLLDDKYKRIVAGSEVYHSILKSKKRNKAKVLIMGDSVGKQMFDNFIDNDTINSLACTEAVSMVGQYILLSNYLQNGNKPEHVYLIYTPFSFRNNLNQKFTYQYFLKPFYTKTYTPTFTYSVLNQIKKIPFYYLCRLPSILASNWSPKIKSIDKTKSNFLSPISVEYFLKIKHLSNQYNFELTLLPTPTKETRKNELNNLSKQEIDKFDLNQDFEEYFSEIEYLNDSCFLDDVHLKSPEKFKKKFTEIISSNCK